MADAVNVARVPMQLSRGCIVVSIQVDLSDAVLAQFRTDLLDLLQRSGAEAVILDVSGIAIMDLEEYQALRDTMSMAALMGARTIFSGFQAGVVSALVELDARTDDIEAAFNLDSAFELLEPEPVIADDDGEKEEPADASQEAEEDSPPEERHAH
ncbi:MAG: STAS domain-containing protein [Halieaceae bacterium]|jgi:rsbT antagonist protein RsbS|nr:STAS domain-containing protein [Halieaceae bacterium]